MAWQEVREKIKTGGLMAILATTAVLSLLLITSLAGAAAPEEATIRRAYILPTRTIQPSPVTAGAVVLAATPSSSAMHPSPGARMEISPIPLPTSTPTSALPDTAPPVRILIPAIGVDAPVQPVDLTAAHEIGVPRAADAVGWYQHSNQPGEVGNALFSGHLDTSSGAPAVFWRLKELSAGDSIYVQTGANTSLMYIVVSVVSYPYDKAPLVEIYGSDGQVQLTLITCSGAWQRNSANYDQRLIVSALLANPDSSELTITQ